MRSGTSIGANVSEAEKGQTRADFNAKMNIALKEANETEYWLKLLCKTEYLSEKEFEINVSKYSVDAIYRAEHTDELVEDRKVHLRIDYKVSGIGSNSCGPGLLEKYQLNEKEIDFAFSVRPIL